MNKVDVDEALHFQANWLNQQRIDYYLYGGDLFNSLDRTQRYFARLQAWLPHTKVFYILGNHDMLNDSSFSQVEHPTSPLNLHDRFIDLPDSNWRIIGNNGWYDYTFSSYRDQSQKVRAWKNVFWLDSSIDQLVSDLERMARVLAQVKAQLTRAAQERKEVIFMTHFAPRHELLAPKPPQVNSPRRERFYQMINAMMGSDRLGELLEESGVVKNVFYGHLHGIHPPVQRQGLTYFNQAVGVKNRRINEWQAADFFAQWTVTLRILDL